MIVIQKKPDGGIKIHILHSGKFTKDASDKSKRHFTKAKALKNLNSNDYFLVDENPKPKDIESRKQLYWENDSDGNPRVKIDYSWEKRIMPDQLVKKKYLARLNKNFTDSVNEQNPDTIKCLKLYSKIEECKNIKAGIHNESSFWTQVAIDGLDEKVAKGEIDKPLIRQKLIEKLNELKRDGK